MWPDNQSYGAINPGTTWGVDVSPENGYGVGANFAPAMVNARAATAQSATPSVMWLFLAVVLVLVLK